MRPIQAAQSCRIATLRARVSQSSSFQHGTPPSQVCYLVNWGREKGGCHAPRSTKLSRLQRISWPAALRTLMSLKIDRKPTTNPAVRTQRL
jgi:hypothetical protein